MTDLDFYARAVVDGTVMGLGQDSLPEDWEDRLGVNYVDDVRKGLMRRDFGLVEVSFQRVRGIWRCFGVGIQVHRLDRGVEAVVPAPVRAEFGEFGSPVGFAGVDAAVARMGGRLESANDGGSTYHDQFLSASTNARVHVVAQVDDPGVGGTSVGDVWSIHLSWRKNQDS
ncbi:hypothetical protein SAMN05421504_102293 [Amycolatopsis xylanica]|uniref:Uncharacterized protein n=1 Tax=Amycolatopsis xylanica TaxID=589385 RepID=A0A1H2YY97_9PSEU|nr:hypothetical protein [Amycolatopsis xylanica]SDX09539.1 hypothetical protein SAMN05421504_102293 [Amycolatopsis xylanica]